MILQSTIIYNCFSLWFHFEGIVVIHCHNLLCDVDCPVFIINLDKPTYAFVSSVECETCEVWFMVRLMSKNVSSDL